MIKDHHHKVEEIVTTIKTRISEINKRYRTGPDLSFYKRLNHLRNNSPNIESFLRNHYHVEIVYAALVSFDMNTRRARIKYFDDFKANILSCLSNFKQLEALGEHLNSDFITLMSTLRDTYKKLNLMKTKAKLVSNAKLLHFLFPNLFMPIDGNNILSYLYGSNYESVNRYIEIIEFSHGIMNMAEDWTNHLDNNWNATVPKMIDNAIILLVGKSVK